MRGGQFRRLAVAPAAALLVAAGAAALAQAQLRPGEYESITEIQMPGVPATPQKESSCVTAEDIKNMPTLMAEEFAEGECKMSDLKSGPTSLAFTSMCDSDGTRYTIAVQMTFTSDTYSGTMSMKAGDGTTIAAKMSGRRLGDCR